MGPSCGLSEMDRTRVAAILVGIDANELNNVLTSRHFIMFKFGKIGDLLSCSKHAFSILHMTVGQPNSDLFAVAAAVQ